VIDSLELVHVLELRRANQSGPEAIPGSRTVSRSYKVKPSRFKSVYHAVVSVRLAADFESELREGKQLLLLNNLHLVRLIRSAGV